MKIHGREVGFMLTVGASAEIAKLCPSNDISRLGELFGDDYVASIDIVSKIVVALNKGFEMAKSFEEQGYQPKPLTHEELMTLTTPQLMELQREAMAAFKTDSEGTVEVAASKK